jgi:predicted esterase
MKLSLLPVIFGIVIGTRVLAEPVFDIPEIKGAITVDGRVGDWKTEGFIVEVMSGGAGDVRPPENFDPSFRAGWNKDALFLLVTVRDDQVAESDDQQKLFAKDSVELFVGRKQGAQEYFQILTGTGSDERFPKLRTMEINRRKSAPEAKIAVEAAATRKPGAYTVEARLPWSNLGISPKSGDEIALQICVNDVDSDGPRITAAWFPNARTSADPSAMHRVRLAAEPSPAVRLIANVSLDRGSTRIDLLGPAALAGKTATAKVQGEAVAMARFESEAGRSRMAFLVPLAETVEISYGETGHLTLDCGDTQREVERAIAGARVVAKGGVFSDEKFPTCDFQYRAATEAVLGKCTLTPTFYDADFNEVQKAAKPGRYGAIVKVQTPNAGTFNRFLTLYRTAEKVDWKVGRIGLGSVEFPPGLGVDPSVVAEQKWDIENVFYDYLTWGFEQGTSAAITFAGLHDISAGSGARTQANGPFAADMQWWYELKKRTNNLRTDYYLHLPAAYETEPDKKWPVILFLHGSGERGYNLPLVKKNGLPKELDDKPEFPFIVVGPQCSPSEWWSPPELNALLDRVEAKYRVDRNRIYLHGLSMGGYGAWALAAASPGRFAAVVPICGGGDPREAHLYGKLPIWVFHGGKDETVPLLRSKEMVEAIEKAGGNVKFTVFPDAGHDSWTPAYAMPELYDWLLQQKASAAR